MSNKNYSVSEQVGNLLNVLAQHKGQFVLGKLGKATSSLNPLMSDGGIQPPGEPLFGPMLFNSREECEAHVERVKARRAQRKPTARGICQNPPGKPQDGRWWLWTDSNLNAHSVFNTQAAAQAQLDHDKLEDSPQAYCSVSVEEWVMQTTLHGKVAARYQTLREVLAQHPEFAASAPEAISNMPEHWVVTLAADEDVDVALNGKGDGISEDCFMTLAGELVRAGFGQLSFERNAHGVTVFVDTREEFARIAAACE